MQNARITSLPKRTDSKHRGRVDVGAIPPYGREISKWVKKAVDEVERGVPLVVMLLPARTDTKWFHEYCVPYGKTEFLKGRLKFGNATKTAPFPSMVVIFERKVKL